MKNDFGKVMVSGGNSFVLPYVDYILDVPLDSSQYLKSSNAIPFVGMVLHGYVNFTGSALNMAGDLDYELLKAIENGSSMYFVLCFQNTNKLKEDEILQKYYSVNFDTWLEGLVESYNKLNGALSDVQDKLIIDHEFITGVRVLTEEEYQQAVADKLRAEEESKKEETEAPETEAPVDSETEVPADTDAPVDSDTDVDTNVPVDDPDADPDDLPADSESGNDDVDAPAEDTEDDAEEDKEDDKLSIEEQIAAENLIDNGKIVKVTYEGGKVFILNYNNFKVSVEGVEIEALGFHTYTEGGEG